MARSLCKYLGVLLIVVGAAGFFTPTIFGMHLNLAHNLVHILSGVLACYVGFAGPPNAPKTFSIVFGAIYGLLGIAGFACGPGEMTMMGTPMATDHLLRLIPGVLELGTQDHVVHVILGATFLFAGFATEKTLTLADVAPAEKEESKIAQ